VKRPTSVGAGGLGCPVLQYLAAAGIGTLGIIDFDDVEESNLQRQILFGTSSLGKNKALAAKKRLEDLNPDITINAYPYQLTANNALDLFKQYDIIVDGTDNFATRYLINDAAIICNKPIVYGAIYKFEGQVSVFNYKDGPSYRCLFPNPPKLGSVANCSEIGVLGVLPGIIGTLQANEVIKIILGFDHVLSGKLFCFNAKTSQTSTLKISRSDSEIENVLDSKDNFHELHNDISCSGQIPEKSFKEVLEIENIQFIDVREMHEQPQIELQNCIHIPLGNLEQNLNLIDSNKSVVLFCQSGLRSKQAVELLTKHNILNCFSLKGGITEINKVLK
jgi:adenylyltransferase/sulfurtransferase